MARLRDDEIRRLRNYLSRQVQDAERLAEIEDALRDECAEEFLREPDLLIYFPEQTVRVTPADGSEWRLRIIPHASLRMVQRGISQTAVVNLFRRFVETCATNEQIITTGPYTIFGRTQPRGRVITLRADVDIVGDESGRAHAVTVNIGRGTEDETTVVRV